MSLFSLLHWWHSSTDRQCFDQAKYIEIKTKDKSCFKRTNDSRILLANFSDKSYFRYQILELQSWAKLEQICRGGGGETDLERGYGDVWPWRPPFHAAPVVCKGPISSKRVSSQDPLLRKFGNFSLYSLNFHSNFSSQVPKFGHFQLTSSQIWTFSVHKPPNMEIFSSQVPLFRGKYQFASSTLRKSGPHTPTWKKLSAPLGLCSSFVSYWTICSQS